MTETGGLKAAQCGGGSSLESFRDHQTSSLLRTVIYLNKHFLRLMCRVLAWVSLLEALMLGGGLLQVLGNPKDKSIHVCICLLILLWFCGLANLSS